MRRSSVALTSEREPTSPKNSNSTAGTIRASVLRIDSPTKTARATSQTADEQPQSRSIVHERMNTRASVRGVGYPSTMNGTTAANGALAASENRRVSLSPLAPTLRKVSAERVDTPARLNAESFPSTLPTTNENDATPWSSAVGHATTSGKSGRVIERLMAENDRLKRDLELQLLRSQELERSLHTMRPQLDALRAENSNLSHLKTVDGSLLARRDRKIESLKEDLANERSRRESSEALARQTMQERDVAVENAKRDLQRAQEEAKHSTTHAGILEQSHRQLSTEYRMRAERWRKDIDVLNSERKTDVQKLARLEVVTEQMRNENEKSRRLQAEIVDRFDEYMHATESWKQDLEGIAVTETARSRQLSDEMETVVNKMRWVMSNQAQQAKEPPREPGSK